MVDVNGTAPFTYQWQKPIANGTYVNIIGATDSNYTISDVQLTDSKTYRVQVQNTFGNITSNAATLVAGTAPSIVSHPVDLNGTVGTDVTITATATGTDPLSYQWRRDGVDLNGATTQNLTLNGLTSSQTGAYSVHVSSPFGTATSNTGTLTVGYAPLVLTQPADRNATVGTHTTFVVDVNGTAPFTYQWQRDINGSYADIGGATDSNYTISDVQFTDSGSYRVQVQNTYGNITSNAATLAAGSSPTILIHPVDINATTGDNVGFTVQASGTPTPNYQWYRDETPITDAITSSLPINNVRSQDNGNYWVKVFNAGGTIESLRAQLIVGGAPVIFKQPSVNSPGIGTTIAIDVGASGAAPLAYQWFKNGIPIPDMTSSSLTLKTLSASDDGNYFVRVSNTLGATNSAIAVVKTGVLPLIVEHPVSKISPANKAIIMTVKLATFTVDSPVKATTTWKKDGSNVNAHEAFGITEYVDLYSDNKRKWFKTSDQGWCFLTPEGKLIRKGTAADWNASLWTSPQDLVGHQVLFIRKTSATDAGSYQATVTNDIGSVLSDPATIEIQAPPVITAHPQNLTVNKDSNATFTVEASGSALSYQWRKDGILLAGENSPTLVIHDANGSHSGEYTCLIANAYDSATSNPANLTVQMVPEITRQPVGVSTNEGTTVILSIMATGGNSTTYTWKKEDQSFTGVQVSAHIPTYDTSKRKWLKDELGNWCFMDPQGYLFHKGTRHHFGIEYWQNPSLLIGPNFLVINQVDSSDAGSYRCVVSNQYGSTTSNIAVVNVHARPIITQHPEDTQVAGNASGTFSVTATGTNLTYQWYKDNSPLAGATNASFTVQNVSTSDQGRYHCKVSNPYGVVPSNGGQLTVITPPVIIINPTDINGTVTQSTVLMIKAENPFELSYQWTKDGAKLANGSGVTIEQYSTQFSSTQRRWVRDSNKRWGFITPDGTLHFGTQTYHFDASYWDDPTKLVGNNYLAVNNLSAANSGAYRCIVSNVHGSTNSSPATFSIVSPPVITAQPVDIVKTEGAAATFSITAAGDGVTYQWKKNGNVINNATNSTFTIASTTIADAGNYLCVATNMEGSTASQPASLAIMAPPVFTLQPTDINASHQQAATLLVNASGVGPLSYSWEKSSDGVNFSAVSAGETHTIATRISKYDSATRKWFRSGDGSWSFVTPHGYLYKTGKMSFIGKEYWENPANLVGKTALTIRALNLSDGGIYRAKATNGAGTASSNTATLSVSN